MRITAKEPEKGIMENLKSHESTNMNNQKANKVVDLHLWWFFNNSNVKTMNFSFFFGKTRSQFKWCAKYFKFYNGLENWIQDLVFVEVVCLTDFYLNFLVKFWLKLVKFLERYGKQVSKRRGIWNILTSSKYSKIKWKKIHV